MLLKQFKFALHVGADMVGLGRAGLSAKACLHVATTLGIRCGGHVFKALEGRTPARLHYAVSA